MNVLNICANLNTIYNEKLHIISRNIVIICFPVFILNDLCLHLHVHNRRKLMLIYQRESKRGNIYFSKECLFPKPEINQIYLLVLIFAFNQTIHTEMMFPDYSFLRQQRIH